MANLMNQSNKHKIHIYTDCPYFGGCENMLSVFSYSKLLNESFDVSIHYRYSKKYDKGFTKRVNPEICSFHVKGIYSGDYIKTIKNDLIRRACYLLEATLFKYPLAVWNIFVLTKHFKNRVIDILHINNGGYPAARSCNAAVIAAKLVGVRKIIYVVNNKPECYKNPMRWLDWPIDRLVKKSCNQFITGSKFSSSILRKVLKLPHDKAMVINNAVNIQIKKDSKSNLRLALGHDDKEVFAGIVAVHEKRKGHIYCLKAYREILNRGLLPPKLLIEGRGRETMMLKSYAKENQLDEFVIFVGHIDSVHKFYQSIDFLVLPSIDFEDFPNVVIEAMAAGLPVIGTKVAGIPEQIIDGENGYLVEPKNYCELSDAILKLASCEFLRKAQMKRSKELYEKRYTPDVAINKYLQLYSNL